MLCDEPMKIDLGREASQNGDMPVLEPASNIPESVREPSVSAAERKAVQIREAAERELKAAREEAARLKERCP